MGGAESTRLRILVVEDNVDDVELMINRLADRSGRAIDLTTAGTLGEAKDALERHHFDLALLDLQLPDASGIDALERLKKARPALPIIVVTGSLDRELRRQCLAAGAEEAVSKQDSTSQLFSLVLLYVVERKRARREQNLAEERARFLEAFLEQAPARALAIGTLAAGIVHEINNPLAALIANLEMMGHDLKAWAARGPVPADITDELERSRTSADRVRRAVGDLRIFSTTETDKRELVDVERVLDSALRMTANEIRHRAKLVRNYGRVPPVLASEARLGQVFLTLLVSAAQSIPDGDFSHNHIVVTTVVEKDGRIVITIADTGRAMTAEEQAQVLTPSYATEEIAKGKLGISICQRIIASLGGDLTMAHPAALGNEFRISLAPAVIDQEPAAEETPVNSPEKRGRVLVIDDEPQMLHAVKRMLAPKHEVSAWSDAEAALALLKKGERFDVILCDLMMPQMTGRDFYESVLALDPDLPRRIVFMTAGAFTPRSREFLDAIENARLEKPFDRAVLRTLVDSLIRS